MSSYIKAFVVTLSIYSLIFGSFLYSFNEPIKLNSKQQTNNNEVKISVFTQEKQTIKNVPKKIEQKIQKPKRDTKEIKKIKKIKQKIKKAEIKKQVKVEKQNKKVIKKTIKKEMIKKQIKKNKTPITKKDIPILDKTDLNKLKNNYLTKIKQTINQNKFYPKLAIKRAIQGDVTIQFTISKEGELLFYKIIKGKRIFKKSIVNALEKSFPIKPKKDILHNNLDITLTLQYRLHN